MEGLRSIVTHKWLPLAMLVPSLVSQQRTATSAKFDLLHPVTIKVRFINYKNGKPLKGLKPLFFEPQLSYVERDKVRQSDKSGLVDVPIPEPGTPYFELADAPPWHACGEMPIPIPWGSEGPVSLNTTGQVPIETILTKGATMDISPGRWCPLTEAQAQALYDKYPPQPGIITYFVYREPYWFF